MTRPIWFLDVDGVINSFTMPSPHDPVDSDSYVRTELTMSGGARNLSLKIIYSTKVVSFINRTHQDGLAEVRWLTTWTDQAATVLAPALGFDDFEVCSREPAGHLRSEPMAWHGRDGAPANLEWWKKSALRTALGDSHRPFVWTDDDLNGPLRSQTKNEFKQPNLLIQPSTTPGLDDLAMRRIESFLHDQMNPDSPK